MALEDFVLAVYDEPSATLAERAVSRFAAAYLPGWSGEIGRLETVLLESMASLAAPVLSAANRAPLAVAKGVMALNGVVLDRGLEATATVLFHCAAACTIPAGFRVQLQIESPRPILLDFETTVATVVTVAPFTATVAVRATLPTALANGVASGPNMDPVSSLFQLDRCELASTVVGGRDPETDDGWYSRASFQMERLTDTLNTANHFTAFMSGEPGISQVFAEDRYSPSSVTPEPHPGNVTVGAVTTTGGLLDNGTRVALLGKLAELCPVDLVINWLDPTITPIDYVITVRAFPGFTVGEMQAAITARIQTWLSPVVTLLGSDVYANEAIAQVDGVPGVDTVLSLAQSRPASAPAAIINLARFETATAGTVTVTVT